MVFTLTPKPFAFADLHASADWFRWNASATPTSSPDQPQTALGVALQSSPKQACLVFAIQPSPPKLTADATFEIDKIIAAVAVLGTSVVQQRPPVENPYAVIANSPTQTNNARFGFQLPSIILPQPYPPYPPAGYGYMGRAGPQFYGRGLIGGTGRR